MDQRLATRRTLEQIAELSRSYVNLLMNDSTYRSPRLLEVVVALVHVIEASVACSKEIE